MEPQPRFSEAAPAGWDALLANDPNATPAHRPGLWRAFASSMRMSPCFIAARDGGRLAGGAAVLIERRGGFSWIHGLPMLMSAAPLALPGRHEAVDIDVARGIGELQRVRRAVGGEWAFYRPLGPAPHDATLAAAAGETRMLDAAVVDLAGGLDAAARRIDRKTRQEIRRAARRLRFAEDAVALDESYAMYAHQARGWSGHRALPLELSRRLMAERDASGPLARLFTVRDGRGLLAATLALDGPRETMLWWSGAHADARSVQAFGFLLWSVVEWANGAGRARVNFGASAGRGPVEAFKASLGTTAIRYPVCWLDARDATPAGRLLAHVQARVRRGRPRGTAS